VILHDFDFARPGIWRRYANVERDVDLRNHIILPTQSLNFRFFISPLTEIRVIGRNSFYIVASKLFFVISVPTAFVNDFTSLMVLQLLQSFFGSPAIAKTGAPSGNLYNIMYFPYHLGWWVFSAWAGPRLRPKHLTMVPNSYGALDSPMSGFAIIANEWRWSLYEIIFMVATLVFSLFIFLLEMPTANILLGGAQRIGKVIGNPRFQAHSEIGQKYLSVKNIVVQPLIKAVECMVKDPAVFFANMYTALFYATYFTFFQVFPRVFPPMYGFSLGDTGLAFLHVKPVPRWACSLTSPISITT
jgi:MFS transporter, DHA1 family, multidrug resistance protein